MTIAYLLFVVKLNAAWIAVLVYAFRHGGATTSGVVAAVLLLPGAALGPLVATVADRRSPTVLLAAAYALEAVALGGIGVAVWSGAPPFAVYALALAEQTLAVAVPPAHYAALPAVARGAADVVSADVAAGWGETAGLLGGAMVASVLLSLDALGALFASAACLMAAGAVLVQPVQVRGIAAADDSSEDHRIRSLVKGLRIAVGQRRVRAPLGLISAQYAVVGALDVLLVVVAIRELGRGQGWVGYLNTAYGVGALAVGVATASLVSRRTGPIVGSVVSVTAAAFALIASFPAAGLVLLLVAVLGASRALLLLVARARLQVSSPPGALARVFGVAEGLTYLVMAVGAAAAPTLIHAVGVRGALLVVGALLPVAALAGSATLRRFDEVKAIPVAEVALLRSLPHFADVPAPALESLALALERVDILAGVTIVRQGEHGDRFYAIADGEVQITVDGRPRRVLGRGQGFGEIALLRDQQRTATVTAIGQVTVYALGAEPFHAALTGHAPMRQRVDALVSNLRMADVERTLG